MKKHDPSTNKFWRIIEAIQQTLLHEFNIDIAEYWQKMARWSHLNQTRRLVILAVGVGLTCGLASVFLVTMIELINDLFYRGLKASDPQPLWVIFIPALGGLLVGPLIAKISPETKGHGVPEVILAVAKNEGRIRPRVALTKVLASSLTIGSGGSAGREGPIVQIGSAIGSNLARLLKEPPEMIRVLVACGAAGGIAASFNAPLAGVVFSMEVILREFATKAFAMVVISSVTASVFARIMLGEDAFFYVPPYEMHNPWEILAYALLGVGAALVARFFISTLYSVEDRFDKLPIPDMFKPALGGLLLGALAYQIPQIRGTGYASVEAALRGDLTLSVLVLLFLGKIIGTSLTLGSGSSGGIFAPTLFFGAMFGGIFARLIHTIFPMLAIEPGAYAVVSMGAMFSGVAFSPITSILVIFEMTHDYGLILPMMVACVLSALVSRGLSPDSIYTLKLSRRGIKIESPEGSDILSRMKVDQAMSRKVETLPQAMTLELLIKKVRRSPHSGFPVVDSADQLVGLVTYEELREGLMADRSTPIVVADLMRQDPPTAYPDEFLEDVVSRMRHHDIGRIPVISRKTHNKVLGIITDQDIVKALGKAVQGS